MTPRPAPATPIDAYVAGCPPDVQRILRRIRQVVRKAVPEAEERLSYRMPTFFADGVLLHVGAFRTHIGLFPPVRGDARLEQAVVRYAGPKGNLRLPLDQPIPYALIARIAKHRRKQNAAKADGEARSRRG